MKTSIYLLRVALIFFVITPAFCQNVDEIIEKHVQAMGGKENLNKVKTLITERSMSASGVDVTITSSMIVGKSIRNDSEMMGHTITQVYHNGEGWVIQPAIMGGDGTAQDMTKEQVKQQLSQLDPFGALINYQQKGHKVKLVGKEKLGQTDHFHIIVYTADGLEIDEYLNTETYMVTKVSVPGNEELADIRFEGFDEIEGIKFPKNMLVKSQMGTINFTTQKVLVNPAISEEIFVKPGK
ncbi:hypothetical protein [Dyadobacter tibetensis]|uniref:hypothetical protein n=1 Tax=Dyadobacter tibetensis TaxID=1211851 RepID=UPI0004707CD3|nr:hypothetical protein [Dyadobacter tibetensis]